MSSSSSSSLSQQQQQQPTSFLVIVLDISPLAWGERYSMRTTQDKARQKVGKSTVGPVVLPEVLDAVMAFASAAASLERNCRIAILAVADNESAIIFPRKNHDVQHVDLNHARPDLARLPSDVLRGVKELLQKAAVRATINDDPANRLAGMAGATSRALCYMNRFLVASASGAGISALHSTVSAAHDPQGGGGGSSTSVPILALSGKTGGGGGGGHPRGANKGSLSPRMLLIQVSDDRSRDYNAMMNCAFAAAKQQIVLDGCFLGILDQSSSFLEQACDLTGGIYLTPKGATPVGGALTEVLVSGFLPPLIARHVLNVPAIHKVDFRARCFESHATVDMAYVCNQCLSIYKIAPTTETCPTCNAKILVAAKNNNGRSKRC